MIYNICSSAFKRYLVGKGGAGATIVHAAQDTPVSKHVQVAIGPSGSA